MARLALFAAIAWGVSTSKLVVAWDGQALAGLRDHITTSWLRALAAVSRLGRLRDRRAAEGPSPPHLAVQ
jgi:hypothetical protein